MFKLNKKLLSLVLAICMMGGFAPAHGMDGSNFSTIKEKLNNISYKTFFTGALCGVLGATFVPPFTDSGMTDRKLGAIFGLVFAGGLAGKLYCGSTKSSKDRESSIVKSFDNLTTVGGCGILALLGKKYFVG